MRRTLILLTKSVDPLNDIVVQVEKTLPEHVVEVMDLTVEQPDYPRVLKSVFESDSVQVW